MEKLAQLLVAGLVTGSVYGMIAAGYAVLYTATRFVNFALGAQAMLGGYLAYVAVPDLSILVRLLISIGVGVAVSVGTWVLLYQWAARRDILSAVIMSFAVSIIIEEAVRLTAGPRSIGASSPFGTRVFTLWDLTISAHQLAVIVISWAMFVIILVGLSSSRSVGVRAMFQDIETAGVLGLNTARLTWILFAVAGALASLAGVLAAPLLALNPYMGLNLALIGFVGAVLGGLGHVRTAIAGSLLLGLVEALFAGYISTDYRTALVYALFIVVLVARPTGLLGRMERLKL